MSITKERISLAKASDLAARIVAELATSCERIEIAGSIRRKKATVGDIELVAIALMEDAGLFPGATPPVSMLEAELCELVAAGRLTPLRDGDKWKTYRIGSTGINLDLFVVTPQTWGVQLAIRTGPGDFSQQLVVCRGRTCRCGRPGLLAPGCLVRDGRVWELVAMDGVYEPVEPPRGATTFADHEGLYFRLLDTPEERDFFKLAGGWVEPEQRA